MALFTLTTPAKVFRFVAFCEAVTWLGLLIGMAFKYLPEDGSDAGVHVFGRLHGAAFLAYLPACVFAIRRLRWGFGTAVLAILASLPPFGTLFFERWAVRTGRLGELSTQPVLRAR